MLRYNIATTNEREESPMNNYTLRSVGGHIEVYDAKGHFVFSADTRQEALQDIRTLAA